MKTMKRLAVLTGTMAVAGTLLSPSAFAATGVLPEGTSAGNGRDHGYGNCGYNNGGETKLTGAELRERTGMGGHRKGDVCSSTTPEVPAPAPAPEPAPVVEPVPDPVVEPEYVEIVLDDIIWD